ALENGLVDKIGTLEDAIKHVAAKAKLGDDYEVRVVPEPKNFIEQIMEEISGGKEDKDNKDLSADLRARPAGTSVSLVDLALPYLQNLDPQRVRLIKTALWRMEMINREGAALMMPEIRIGD